MNKILTLAMVLALSAGAATAKPCKDATGKFTKCPAPATAMPAATAKATPMTAAHHPICKVGVSIPCGNSCISKSKICHKG